MYREGGSGKDRNREVENEGMANYNSKDITTTWFKLHPMNLEYFALLKLQLHIGADHGQNPMEITDSMVLLDPAPELQSSKEK